jgi:GAF domain-containing protein
MSRESTLVRALVEIADNLVEDFDVIDVLTILSDRCVEVVDVDAAGVMLVAPNGELQVVASSSDAMRNLELFELQADEGPCVDCVRHGIPVVNIDLSGVDAHWPRFAHRAMNDGFQSVHALPMHLRGHTVGAVNMFRINPGPLGPDDVLVAQALADVATIAIIQHRASVDAAVLITQLNGALTSRVIIEQAKGMVSQAADLNMDEAFQRLRNHARNHKIRLTELSRGVVEGTASIASLDSLSADLEP